MELSTEITVINILKLRISSNCKISIFPITIFEIFYIFKYFLLNRGKYRSRRSRISKIKRSWRKRSELRKSLKSKNWKQLIYFCIVIFDTPKISRFKVSLLTVWKIILIGFWNRKFQFSGTMNTTTLIIICTWTWNGAGVTWIWNRRKSRGSTSLIRATKWSFVLDIANQHAINRSLRQLIFVICYQWSMVIVPLWRDRLLNRNCFI